MTAGSAAYGHVCPTVSELNSDQKLIHHAEGRELQEESYTAHISPPRVTSRFSGPFSRAKCGAFNRPAPRLGRPSLRLLWRSAVESKRQLPLNLDVRYPTPRTVRVVVCE
jgi:hypothetical protein